MTLTEYNGKVKLPERYCEEMQELLQEDYPAYLQALEKEPVNALRVNNARIATEDFLSLFPYELERIPWIPNGFYLPEDCKASTHPYYYAGLYYLQEPSAMTPAHVLGAEEGEVILDACAAPGGKSGELSVRLGNSGCLLSNDLSVSRQSATRRHLERFGAKNVLITANDVLSLKESCQETFDRILLDAPCSGEGMFRRDPELIRSWEKRGPEAYATLQKELLKACAGMLKEGGRLVYSTCTFSVKEDEEVLAEVLSEHPELKLIPLQDPHFAPGVRKGLEGCARLYPHRLQGEGHFVALLQKDGERKASVFVKEAEQKLPDFFADVRAGALPGSVVKRGTRFYCTPALPFSRKGLRILNEGVFLGEEGRHGYEPSQALAMALKREDFARSVSFAAEDPRTLKYLRGETVTADSDLHGWVLVCVDGYPLGFAKAEGKTLKNKIDKGWRIV